MSDILLETELKRRAEVAVLRADLSIAREALASAQEAMAIVVGQREDAVAALKISENKVANLERMLWEK